MRLRHSPPLRDYHHPSAHAFRPMVNPPIVRVTPHSRLPLIFDGARPAFGPFASTRAVAAILAFCCMITAAVAQSVWEKTRWNNETAWVAVDGEVQAVVSEARCRLIFLGPRDSEQNLLSAPKTLSQPIPHHDIPNWGGHRFWLGPQSRWMWPPLTEWEFSAAAAVETKNDVLILHHPHLDPKYPELVREYSWQEHRLVCTVRWRSTGSPFYAMHVVAVDAPASIPVQLLTWEHTPDGMVAVQGDSPKTKHILPNPAIRVDGRLAVVSSGFGKYKLGFYPQPLRVARGTSTLALNPGSYTGVAIESPDLGYLTQLWVGDASNSFSELEQLSPYLLPDASGWCSTTISLQVAPANR